jgi:hypothetical protein
VRGVEKEGGQGKREKEVQDRSRGLEDAKVNGHKSVSRTAKFGAEANIETGDKSRKREIGVTARDSVDFNT